MNGIDVVLFVLINLLGINAQLQPTADPDPQIDMPIYCTVGIPELPTAQPFAIGRSGDQNETTNLAIVAIVDGDKLTTLGAVGFCGWHRLDGAEVSCEINGGVGGVLTIDAAGQMTFKGGNDNTAISGESLARRLGMVLCGRQVWWSRVAL